MKIAFCLHGLANGRNDDGNPVTFDVGHHYFNRSIFSKNEVDVFFHTWSIDSEKELISLYNPKKSQIESQITFDSNTKIHSIKSRWYSMKKVLELKQEYEIENDFKYDCVFVTRFDLAFLKEICLKDFDMSYFYAGNWEKDYNTFGLMDLWFFSNSSLIDKFISVYDTIDLYIQNGCGLSNHLILKTHVDNNNLTDYIRYYGIEGRDFLLVRWLSTF